MDKSKEKAVADAIGRLNTISGRANVITKVVKDIGEAKELAKRIVQDAQRARGLLISAASTSVSQKRERSCRDI